MQAVSTKRPVRFKVFNQVDVKKVWDIDGLFEFMFEVVTEWAKYDRSDMLQEEIDQVDAVLRKLGGWIKEEDRERVKDSSIPNEYFIRALRLYNSNGQDTGQWVLGFRRVSQVSSSFNSGVIKKRDVLNQYNQG